MNAKMDGRAVERDTGNVQSGLDDLAKQIDDLACQVMALTDRLKPILRPIPEVSAKEAASDPRMVRSLLADALDAHSKAIQRIRRAVVDAGNALDL